MNHKFAHYRALDDLRLSVLHDYHTFKYAAEQCIAKAMERTGMTRSEAVRRFSIPPILLQHWQNRAPWNDIPAAGETVQDAEPIRIKSICINTGVLYLLRKLIDSNELAIHVDCNYFAPLEYLSSTSLIDDVDVFVTEIASPFYSEVQACDNFALAYPIHTVVEGYATKNKEVGTGGLEPGKDHTTIVLGATSSEGQAYQWPVREKIRLQNPKDLEGMFSSLDSDELVCVWEPWLEMIDRSNQDGLRVVRQGHFIMGMFVNRLALEDPSRQIGMIRFLDTFIRQWRSLHAHQKLVQELDMIRLNAFRGWQESFQRAMIIAESSFVPVHPVPEVARKQILELVDAIGQSLPPDQLIIDRVAQIRNAISAEIATLPEKLLPAILMQAEVLIRSRDKPAWQQINEILAHINMVKSFNRKETGK